MISTYQQNCPVLFGADAVMQLPEKVTEAGGTRAFCIFDKGVKNCGIAGKIIKILEDGGITTDTFDEVMPDTPASQADIAGGKAREFGADMVIGIGGGSCLDMAKATAILVDNDLPINQYYAQKNHPQNTQTPLFLIPTTSGTGSEVTGMAVLYDAETNRKETILRKGALAIVDPILTLTVPPQVTAETGMDAMSHAIESYTTNCGNPKSEILSLAAIKLVFENLKNACFNGDDLEARTNLCLASNLAGIAFNDASVHFGHAAAHEFGVQFHMSHGAACALTLPEVVAFAGDKVPDKIRKIAEVIKLDIPDDASGAEIAEQIAEKIRDLMHCIGIRSFKDYGILREQAVACAKGAVENNWFIICALSPVDIPVMEELIGKMYDHFS